MQLNELKSIVDFAVDHTNSESVIVQIPTFKVGTLGPPPSTNVKSAGLGFDWSNGSFLINPVTDLREIDRDEMKMIRQKYEELSWSHYKITKLKRENDQLKKQIEELTKSGNIV